MTGHTGAGFEMLPITPAGQRFVETRRTLHAAVLAERALQYSAR